MSFLRKTLDTALTAGRMLDTCCARPLRGVCPACTNLSSIGRFESSNNSINYLSRHSTAGRRRALHEDAEWFNLEVTFEDVLKAAKGNAPVRPCIYCADLEALYHYFPDW